MKAAVIVQAGEIAIEPVPDPAPGPQERVVRVAGCGISDRFPLEKYADSLAQFRAGIGDGQGPALPDQRRWSVSARRSG